jgi:hypothetical protein
LEKFHVAVAGGVNLYGIKTMLSPVVFEWTKVQATRIHTHNVGFRNFIDDCGNAKMWRHWSNDGKRAPGG